MTLPLPRLDDRTFADLVEEARALIPTVAPKWTNHNPSDPGMTLIELFAWLAEMLIYRADQVSDAHRLVFLRLLNGPGWKQEDPDAPVEDAVAATLNRIRSRYRAVTTADYEALALAAPGDVARAFALAGRDLGADDAAARTRVRPGWVSVVVLPQEHVNDAEAALLRAAIADRLEPRRLVTARHVVVEPVWAPVSAELLVACRPDVPPERARTAVVGALTRLLDPHRGGRDHHGWPFGRAVFVSELNAELALLPEVVSVPEVRLSSTCADGARRCEPAGEEWNDLGEQVGLRLAPHQLPRAALDPSRVVVSPRFVPVTARVTAVPASGVEAADARRAVKEALRSLFHPLHGGPAGTRAWRLGSDSAAELLDRQLAGTAGEAEVVFAGDPEHVTVGERHVTTVRLGERDLADLRTEVVIR